MAKLSWLEKPEVGWGDQETSMRQVIETRTSEEWFQLKAQAR